MGLAQIREKCVPSRGNSQGKGNGLGALQKRTEEYVPGEKGMRVRVTGDEVHRPGLWGLLTQQFASHFTTMSFTWALQLVAKQASVAHIPVGHWVAGGWIEHKHLSVSFRESKEERP